MNRSSPLHLRNFPRWEFAESTSTQVHASTRFFRQLQPRSITATFGIVCLKYLGSISSSLTHSSARIILGEKSAERGENTIYSSSTNPRFSSSRMTFPDCRDLFAHSVRPPSKTRTRFAFPTRIDLHPYRFLFPHKMPRPIDIGNPQSLLLQRINPRLSNELRQQ